MSQMDYTHRKAKIKVKFLNTDGQALANQKVKVEMQKHQFLFGCGAFDFVDIANQSSDEKAEFWQERADKWLDLYNYATLPFYWGRFEPVEGEPQTEPLKNAALYLKSRGVELKGHPLCWHTACADWLMQYDNPTILRKQLERIKRDVGDFKGLIDRWDVINEVVIMPIFDKYDNAITRISKDLGRIGIVREVFNAAYNENPGAQLLINDFNLSTNYEILIDGCLNAGIPISAIGLQTHQHQGYMGKEKLEEILERFEHFGLPLHFTENTLISGDIMPAHIVDLNDWQVDSWPSTAEGELRQKEETEEMYRILFDHPLVEAITGWDFTDGAWLGAPSGVLRIDNTEKPVYQRLKEMIKDEWWTDTYVETNEQGVAEIEGFKGEYIVSIAEKKETLVLDDTHDTLDLIML